ncbi:hypothetical protein GCM10020216_108440 [Nonomuraea helvata]
MTANPLIDNYFGIDYYNDEDEGDDWTINWAEADCGYGIMQITYGMCLAGKQKPPPSAVGAGARGGGGGVGTGGTGAAASRSLPADRGSSQRCRRGDQHIPRRADLRHPGRTVHRRGPGGARGAPRVPFPGQTGRPCRKL